MPALFCTQRAVAIRLEDSILQDSSG
jgi:hypothetical protein